MRNFLSSGGLGDAVMVLGKLHSPQLVNDINNIHLVHAHFSGILLDELDVFYTYQNIDHEVVKMPFDERNSDPSTWSWILENNYTYEKEIFSSWYVNKDNIEINPFPKIIHKQVEVDILLSPFAGQRRDRLLDIKDLEKFLGEIGSNRKITYVGNTNGIEKAKKNVDVLRDVIRNSNGMDLVDQTSFTELIDIICSSKSVIAPEGFIIYMGGISGRKIFSYNHNVIAINERSHPAWNVKLFNNLTELIKLV